MTRPKVDLPKIDLPKLTCPRRSKTTSCSRDLRRRRPADPDCSRRHHHPTAGVPLRPLLPPTSPSFCTPPRGYGNQAQRRLLRRPSTCRLDLAPGTYQANQLERLARTRSPIHRRQWRAYRFRPHARPRPHARRRLQRLAGRRSLDDAPAGEIQGGAMRRSTNLARRQAPLGFQKRAAKLSPPSPLKSSRAPLPNSPAPSNPKMLRSFLLAGFRNSAHLYSRVPATKSRSTASPSAIFPPTASRSTTSAPAITSCSSIPPTPTTKSRSRPSPPPLSTFPSTPASMSAPSPST